MNLYDNEVEIIRDFQMVPLDSICIVPEGEEESSDVLLSVLDKDRWKYWTESSGKGDLPPDFFCDAYGLMMDVMRVDDHGFVSPKGKIVNPTLAKEHEIIKEFERMGVFVANPSVRLQVLASTDLPTEEDHNYVFYRDSFQRTIGSHIRKIRHYKENHPGYKVIFFVLDESSAYFELDSPMSAQFVTRYIPLSRYNEFHTISACPYVDDSGTTRVQMIDGTLYTYSVSQRDGFSVTYGPHSSIFKAAMLLMHWRLPVFASCRPKWLENRLHLQKDMPPKPMRLRRHY